MSCFRVCRRGCLDAGANHELVSSGSDYTTTVSYGAAVTAEEETREVLDMTMDEQLVPSIVEAQLVADRFIELGVYFDTFDNGVNRAAFNNKTYRELLALQDRASSELTSPARCRDARGPFALHRHVHGQRLERGRRLRTSDARLCSREGRGHRLADH